MNYFHKRYMQNRLCKLYVPEVTWTSGACVTACSALLSWLENTESVIHQSTLHWHPIFIICFWYSDFYCGILSHFCRCKDIKRYATNCFNGFFQGHFASPHTLSLSLNLGAITRLIISGTRSLKAYATVTVEIFAESPSTLQTYLLCFESTYAIKPHFSQPYISVLSDSSR